MIVDILLSGIKDMIVNAGPVAYNLLDGLPVYLPHEDGNKDESYIKILDSSIEEHETLDEFYISTVEICLRTIPAELDADGTTEVDHKAIASQLYEYMRDKPIRLCELGNTQGINVFDIRTTSPRNDTEEGNLTVIEQEITFSRD